MGQVCDYCHGPLSAGGPVGRPGSGRPAAHYCCYGCLSLGEQARLPADPHAPRLALDRVVLKLAVSIFLVGPSMALSLAVNLTPPEPPTRALLQGTVLALTLVVIALLGLPLFRMAIAELRCGRLTIEALFLTTMAGAMAASLQAFLTGNGRPIYFEVVSVLLVVYTLGKLIGARRKASALASTRVWAQSLATCRLVDARQRTRAVDVAAVLPGDTVEVRPGESIAVDGVVREGVGFVAEAPIRGEPFPVVRRPGDRVLAGSAVHDATLRIEATAPGTARQIDRLLQSIEEARQSPAALQQQADRLGRVFLPLVLVVATATFAGWSIRADLQTGLYNAMAVLLVACPCALGLATPIVVWTALGQLAERGLILRSGDVLERLARVDRVLFDKTGTLTDEPFVLRDLATREDGPGRQRVLLWLAAVEAHSPHPVARPFAALATTDEIAAVRVAGLRVVPGCGLEATVGADDGSHRLRVGRPEWLGFARRPESAGLLAAVRDPAAGQRIDLEVDGEPMAVAVLAERLREATPETLVAFARMGLAVEVLTGDATDRAIAVGLPGATGALLPDDKRRLVAERVARGGRPLFVGDGINDAAALAAASVGIALASGTDLANGAASATLYHADLRVLPWAVALGRRAVRTVRLNLLRAAGYNLVGMTLAALGVLHPVAAALLMVVSSVLVAWSSIRLGVSPDECGCSPDEEEPRRAGGVSPLILHPVGDRAGHQGADAPRSPGVLPRAAVHALAFALQGLILAQLAGPAIPTLRVPIAAFAAIAPILALGWARWPRMPHALDMSLGMLTLGNLGMVLGWWADQGFRPVEVGCSCCGALCGGTLRSPGMWLGMFAFANLAMAFLSHRPCRLALFGGGNLGMTVGMLAGGWLAAQAVPASVGQALALSYLGMTAGMVVGMGLGHALGSRLAPAA